MKHLRSTFVAALATIALGLVAAPAQADPPSRSMPGSAADWYLALGDSAAAGYQPGFGDDPTGGYVGHVLDAVQQTDPKAHLRNLACSGETSVTLVAGGRCDYEEGSQLAQALVFLRAHSSSTGLVTLTIGANDVTPCLRVPDQTQVVPCVQDRLATLAANLQQTLTQVHAAAPGARIVVTNYYNPFLAVWFTDPGLASLTTVLQQALNGTIAGVTAAFGSTADVATAFKSYDTTPLPGGVPTNVAMICQFTWMCSKGDIHPNDAGYALIATAVVAKLS